MSVIGEAFVEIRPELARFGSEINRGLPGIAKAAGVLFAGAFAVDKIADTVRGALESGAATAKLGAQLNLSAGDTKAAGKLAGSLYRDNFGESVAGVSDTISTVVRSGLASFSDPKALAEVTKGAQTINDVFGEDVSATMESVRALVNNGLAPDATAALDLVTRGLQSSAGASGDLLDTFTEYSGFFKGLGFDGPTALNLLDQAVKNGVRNTDFAADAWKEFGIRVIDGSKTSTQALTALGLDAGKVASAIAAGGPAAQEMTAKVFTALQGIKDPVQQSAIGVELFGTKWEDSGAAIVKTDFGAAVRASMDGVTGATADATQRVSNTPAAMVEGFKRNFASRATELAAAVISGLGPTTSAIGAQLSQAFTDLRPVMQGALDVARGLFGFYKDNKPVIDSLVVGVLAGAAAFKLITTVQALYVVGLQAYAFWTYSNAAATGVFTTAMNALKVAFLTNPVGIIAAALVGLGAALVIAYKNSETFRAVVNGAWAAIRAGVGVVVDWFTSNVLPMLKSVWDGIAAGASWLWTNVLKPVWNAIQVGFQALVTGLQLYWQYYWKPIFEAVGVIGQWLWNNVLKPTFAAIGAGWKLLVDGVQAVWANVLKPVFELVAAIARWLWSNVLDGIFKAISFGWQVLVAAVQLYWNNVLKPVWSAVATAAQWLWTTVLQPTFAAIGERWRLVLAGMQVVWNTVLKPVFDAVMDVVRNKVAPAFRTGVDAISTQWTRLQDIAKAPVRFVVDTVLNGAIIDNFNKLAGAFGTSKIPRVSLPKGFSSGGYTGDGGKYEPKGVVHGGEWVVPKEATSRLRSAMPGFLESISGLPGYANGGLVDKVIGGARAAAGAVGSALGSLADPEGLLRGAVEGVIGKIPGTGNLREALGGMGSKLLNAVLDKVKSLAAQFITDGAGSSSGTAGRAPSGSIVNLGRWFQSLGARVSEHPAFGGVNPVHKGRGHYKGRAIDVNFGPGGQNATEMAFFDKWAPIVRSQGFKTLWRVAGHFNHLHAETYDTGGLLNHGGTAVNLSGRPERVLDPQQTAWFEAAMRRGGSDDAMVAEMREQNALLRALLQQSRELDNLAPIRGALASGPSARDTQRSGQRAALLPT